MSNKFQIISVTDVKDESQFAAYLDSISKHVDCDVNVLMPITSIEEANRLISKYKISPRYMRWMSVDNWTDCRMFMKMCTVTEEIKKENVKTSFILDTDIIVQDDIFKETDKLDFDIALTTRHYDYWYPINAGVWAVRNSDRVQKLLEFLLLQITIPSWCPYIDWMKKFNRPDDRLQRLDWWCDQDMLNLIWLNREWVKSEFGVSIIDLGPKFNWCPSVEEKIPESYDIAKADILSKIGNSEYKILHFKGRLKELMTR